MIKADIVKAVARELQIKDREALVVVDGLLDSMKEVICENRRLEVRDFGVFQIKTRKERVGRNPRDKVEYPIPARQVVTFRIGKELKARLEDASRARREAGLDQEEVASGAPRLESADGLFEATPPAVPKPSSHPSAPGNPPERPPRVTGSEHQAPPPAPARAPEAPAQPTTPPDEGDSENGPAF